MMRREHGFAMIEALLAAVILSVGVLASFQGLDASRRLSLVAERQTTMAHRAQAEIESLKALPYSELGLTGTSSQWSSSQSDPNGVNLPAGSCSSGGTVPSYQPDHSDHPSTATEPLIINGCTYTINGTSTTYSGGVVAPAQTWTNGAYSGMVYDFITFATDPNCDGTYCAAANDYKRLTVVVTLNGATQPNKPAIMSTFVADPNVDSKWNINQNPTTLCTLGSTTGSCSTTAPGTPSPFNLCDASYSSGCSSSGPPCTGNPLDQTLVTTGSLASPLAPGPDAAGPNLPVGSCPGSTTTTSTTSTTTTTTTTSTATTTTSSSGGGGGTPPCYATDLLIANCQGLPIEPSGTPPSSTSTCGNSPPLDNSKAHSWVGPAIPTGSSVNLTGAGAMTTFLEATSGVSVNATLCLRLYVVANSALGVAGTPLTTNLLSSPLSTTISTNVTAQTGVPTPVTFNFPAGAITAGTSVAATLGPVRIEFVVWIAGSTQPVEMLYDQAQYASEITLMTQ